MVRGPHRRGRVARPARWRRFHGRDEPADLGQGRRRDRVRRLPVPRFDQAAAAVEVPRGRHGAWACRSPRSATRSTADPRQRQLFKNIIYLGALSALFGIDAAEIERLLAEQYRGKEALLDSNRKALALGREHALATFDCPLGLRVERRDRVGNRIFIDGNSAAALGAVYGGATVAAWYPITPSSSLAESFAKLVPASSAPIRRPAAGAMRSCRPRTSSRRSAW